MFEVLLLRLSVLFDSDSKSMMLFDGSVYRREGSGGMIGSGGHTAGGQCPVGGGGGRFLVDSLFDFVERFNALYLNDADIALYCAIVLVSPGKHLGSLKLG